MTDTGERQTGATRLVRAGLACVLGSLVTIVVGIAGFVVLVLPGTPGEAHLRGLGSAAAQGQDEFLRYIGSPAEEALRAAFEVWYVATALPAAVIAGGIVAARVSKGSWLCAAVGGIAPAAILAFSGFPSGTTSITGVAGFLLVAVAAWLAALLLLGLWSRRHTRRGAAEGDV